jgi:hopene-associated glycosyltransferase HpnB
MADSVAVLAIACISTAIWIYLLTARGGFWLAPVRDDDGEAAPCSTGPQVTAWPQVTAIIPARNEADVIAQSMRALITQDYPGRLNIILVDDQSRDSTSVAARNAAAGLRAEDRLDIVAGQTLPAGWAGKVWAMKQGVNRADSVPHPSKYLLFMDADITCTRGAVRQLVLRAETKNLVLTSLMARLRCESWAERALIPAFVFFFQMLYPFTWVNDPGRKTAAAAGGCMLVRRDALRQAGGLETIRNALIDDCALGRALKAVGPVWLGLTDRVHSLRPYPQIQDVGRMVSRSAYHQLRYSPLLLVGTTVGMALTYLAPPLLALFATGLSQILGAAAWLVMAIAFQPMLRFYRVSPLWGVALPAIGCAYLVFTLNSAYQHLRGRGGLWKGRMQANMSGTP